MFLPRIPEPEAGVAGLLARELQALQEELREAAEARRAAWQATVSWLRAWATWPWTSMLGLLHSLFGRRGLICQTPRCPTPATLLDVWSAGWGWRWAPRVCALGSERTPGTWPAGSSQAQFPAIPQGGAGPEAGWS